MTIDVRQFRRRTMLTIIAAGLAGPVAAQDATKSIPAGWNCERCVSADGWELDVEGGPAWVSDDAWRFGNYTGLDEKGWYLFGDVFGRRIDDRRRTELGRERTPTRIGLDDDDASDA